MVRYGHFSEKIQFLKSNEKRNNSMKKGHRCPKSGPEVHLNGPLKSLYGFWDILFIPFGRGKSLRFFIFEHIFPYSVEKKQNIPKSTLIFVRTIEMHIWSKFWTSMTIFYWVVTFLLLFQYRIFSPTHRYFLEKMALMDQIFMWGHFSIIFSNYQSKSSFLQEFSGFWPFFPKLWLI